MANPSSAPIITVETLLDNAETIFTEFHHQAPFFDALIPTHNGIGRSIHLEGTGVEILVIRSGNDLLEVKHFPVEGGYNLTVTLLRLPDYETLLDLHRDHDGSPLRAYTSYPGPRVPVQELSQNLLLYVRNLVADL